MNNTDAEDPGNDLPGKSRRASNSGSVMAAPGSNPPRSGHGQGYGKVILLGEHFVLYGMRAIAAALQCQTECHIVIRSIPEAEQAVPKSSDSSQQPVEDEATCVLGTKWIIHDARPAVVGYISQKKNEQRVAHARILKHLGLRNLTTDERLKNKELHVYLAGALCPTSGNGASAADVVSVTRALNNLFNLGLSDDAVNQCALVGETGYHDTPSGIDNTVATFGGVILYRRGRGYVPKVSFKRVVRPPSEDVLNATKESNDGCFARRPLILRVLCISTGITSGTSEVIKEVRKIMEQDDVQFQKKFLNPYNELVDRALDALMVEDLTTFGQCMYENHKLLKQLTVSCAELDAIVEIAESNNALGAKMTGTGRGGMAIVLCQDEVQQRALSEVFASHKDIARHVWPTSLQVM